MGRFLGIVIIWAAVLGCGALAYKHFILDKENLGVPPTTGGPSAKTKITLALDAFSGYAVLRSPQMKQRLAERGFDLVCVDDKADYAARMKTIQNGETPMAVFTIDALITQSPRDHDPPAAIVMLIDETRGADAMVSYKDGVKDIDALNSDRAKIVLTPDSPSEMLARVIRSQFNLPNLPVRKRDYLVKADGAEDVLKQFQAARPSERKAFVLWEPYVSAALKEPGAQLLADSSQFKGSIVDVLVVQQAYLRQHRDRVDAVVKAYLEVLNDFQRSTGGMAALVKADAEAQGEKLTIERAPQVAQGIWWKNTVENYAHFGLLPAAQAKGLQPLGDMIKRITAVLNQTREPGEPEVGVSRPDKLVQEDVLQQLFNPPIALHRNDQEIRDEGQVPALADADDWNRLVVVGSIQIKTIQFSSIHKDQLTEDAEQDLTDFAGKMRLWPQYYLRIEGHTAAVGDREANMALAGRRAEAVRDFLVKQMGIEPHRLKALAMEPGGGREVRLVALRRP